MLSMGGGTPMRIDLFTYPVSDRSIKTPWEGLIDIGNAPFDDGTVADQERRTDPDAGSAASSPATSAEEARLNFERGREQGFREGRAEEARAQQERLGQAERRGAEQAAHLADQFAAERDRFLATMEEEVVKLALAIAARILRREAQTDPLLLVGAVRVALGQLASTVQVKLRVPAADAPLWAETLPHVPNLRVKPVVVPDESMIPGKCALETDMGSVDLGLSAQLHWMESALFDEASAKEPIKRGDVQRESQAVPL
jgi:flagellar biosynthesis/type III secretory pathway protein FliH